MDSNLGLTESRSTRFLEPRLAKPYYDSDRVGGRSEILREFWLLFGEGFAMLGIRQNPNALCASEYLSERRTFNVERSTLNSFTATLGFFRHWLFDVRCSMFTCPSGAASRWDCCRSSWPQQAVP